MEWLRHVRQNGEGSATTHLKTSGGDIIVALQSCRALRVGDSAVMAAYFIDITAKERAEEETKTQLLRVTALSELSQALMRTMDPAAIHRLLFEKVRTVLPIDDFQIAMARPDSDELEVVFAATREPDDSFAVSTESERIPRGHPLVRAALSGGRPEVFLQTRGDNGLQDQKRHPGLTVLPSALAIPFSSREHVGGVVCAQSATYGAYDSSHVETLGALVAQAALALSNAQGFASLREQQEDLRRLSVQIMTAQETERGRISRELHDGVGQQLTAMKYVLEAIRGASKSGDEAKLAGRISEARELAAQIIADLRSISLDLRPTMLDDLGLKPTVEWLTRQNSERYGIEVNLDYTVGEDTPLPPEIATSAFRIVQEALGNVAKHSKATRVDIAIGMTGASLCLAVSDNGVGFDTVSLPRMQAARGCSGMLNMKERARFLGGDFSLESAPSKGTKLSVSIPVKEVV